MGIIASISLAENDKYISVIEGVVASVFLSPIAGLFGYPLAIMIGGTTKLNPVWLPTTLIDLGK